MARMFAFIGNRSDLGARVLKLNADVLRVRRVELKTSALNARSRAAIRRLGATEEGTLRKHMINADGSARDSVYFSILDDEWPDARTRLASMLQPEQRPAPTASRPPRS